MRLNRASDEISCHARRKGARKDAALTRRIATNAIWNFGGQITQSVVAVVCIPFLVRLLGTPRVGLLSLIWVIVGYFSLLDFGLGPALTKTVSEAIADMDWQRASRLYRAATRIQLVMGLVGGLLMAAFAPYLVHRVLKVPVELQPEALVSVYLCAVAFPLVLLTSSATGMLQAAQRFDAINLVQAPLGVGQFVLPLICAIWSRSLAVIVGVLLVSRVLAVLFLFARVRSLVPLERANEMPAGDELRSLVSFGGWVSVSNIISPLMVYADRFLIGSLQRVSSVAYYSLPSDATLRVLIVPRSLVMAMFPVMSATRDNERLRDLALRSVRYILLLVGIPCLVLFFSAREVMTVWLGADFAARSATVLQILLIGIVANSVAQVPFTLIQATGRADVTAKLHLSEFVPYLVLVYLAIKTWGIEGAAVAWSSRVVVDSGLLFYFARRRVGISAGDFLLHRIPQLLGTLILIGAVSIALHAAAVQMSERWLATFFLAVLLISVGWAVFLTQSERDRMLQAIALRLTRR